MADLLPMMSFVWMHGRSLTLAIECNSLSSAYLSTSCYPNKHMRLITWFYGIINARHMRTRVTVLRLCVCHCVCVVWLFLSWQIELTSFTLDFWFAGFDKKLNFFSNIQLFSWLFCSFRPINGTAHITFLSRRCQNLQSMRWWCAFFIGNVSVTRLKTFKVAG